MTTPEATESFDAQLYRLDSHGQNNTMYMGIVNLGIRLWITWLQVLRESRERPLVHRIFSLY